MFKPVIFKLKGQVIINVFVKTVENDAIQQKELKKEIKEKISLLLILDLLVSASF